MYSLKQVLVYVFGFRSASQLKPAGLQRYDFIFWLLESVKLNRPVHNVFIVYKPCNMKNEKITRFIYNDTKPC